MTKSALAWALAAAGSLAVVTGAPAAAQQADRIGSDTELAADSLARGDTIRAIAALEIQREAAPEDPALLINLGIAYAHLGKDEKARAMFDAALKSSDRMELETADGNASDSQRLARKAKSMLDRGEFRATAERFAQRD
ncbi:tetratricopeptide repeat protein [uncultured Erythrobacter sp.]|uniref:tetratricopeptide repeat protein n=1 Tax=uncultured Erythrobacter sp. TaxID=263913 RepID=UPI0026170AA5|nr:tetratricopeptide repeat protein [uncultured Erythrobacter sp.]